MKHIVKRIVFLILTLVFIVPMFSSKGLNEVNAIDSLKLNTVAIVIDKGDTFSLSVGNVVDAVVTWSSENSNIATVDKNGIVTAVSKGNTNIVANVACDGSANSKQVICEVGVKTSDYLPETPANDSYLAGKDILAGKYVVFSDNTSTLGTFWEIRNVSGSKIIDNEFTQEAALITVEQSQSLVIHRGYAVPVENVSNSMLKLNNISRRMLP